ncbi:unnamed protein product, partial [Staurois parvus]
MSLSVIFKFPADVGTYRGRNPDDRCRHPPEDITGDTAGGTSWDKVSDRGIPEQRRSVFPSVARGYRFCYTREYHQGG